MSSDELTRTVEIHFSPGDVVELRTFKDGRTYSGYFEDRGKLVAAARKQDERGHDVYMTLNKLPGEIAFRRYNRVEQIKGRDQTTSDGDVERRRYLSSTRTLSVSPVFRVPPRRSARVGIRCSRFVSS
jgi:hypothetical protein